MKTLRFEEQIMPEDTCDRTLPVFRSGEGGHDTFTCRIIRSILRICCLLIGCHISTRLVVQVKMLWSFFQRVSWSLIHILDWMNTFLFSCYFQRSYWENKEIMFHPVCAVKNSGYRYFQKLITGLINFRCATRLLHHWSVATLAGCQTVFFFASQLRL